MKAWGAGDLPPPEPTHPEQCFVWRRAYRFGKVTRADVMEAFGLAPRTASLVLADSIRGSFGWLLRRPKHVEPDPGRRDAPPRWASATQLLDALDDGQIEFWQTGLRHDDEHPELPVERVAFIRRRPMAEHALELVVRAIVSDRPVEILYVGLRVGERARWRRILPLAFERMGDQWRIIAADLNALDHRARTYVLTRVSDARVDETSRVAEHAAPYPWSTRKDIPVAFDPRLTDDQLACLRHELKVRREDDVVSLPRRSEREFLARYGGADVSTDVVWPPLVPRIEG